MELIFFTLLALYIGYAISKYIINTCPCDKACGVYLCDECICGEK
jgi:hypothetical protein